MPAASFADQSADEPEEIGHARELAAEVGCPSVSPAAGAALAGYAAVARARAVVEIGTGAGVSTLWLLSGLADRGVLTSVDSDGEHQRAARQSLADAETPSGRARLINGAAAQVLPRLADDGYDVVFCDAEPVQYLDYLVDVRRMMRPGGVAIWHGLLRRNRIEDPSARDPDTVAWRDLHSALRSDKGVRTAVLPVGDGLLVAVDRTAAGTG